MGGQAFSDLKVLDCTEGVAGPYCTKLLADFGAEVIKIEKPGEGDVARRMPPFLNDEPHPEKSGTFFYLNTNKKSITLNLRNETGAKIFKELVKEADILIESFTPGIMSELGLSYETLSELNTRLIMTSISNFGQTSPYRHYEATSLTLFGLGGLMYTMRPPGKPMNRPVVMGGLQAAYMTGLQSFVATIAALVNSTNTNQGTWIDIAAMECVASNLAYHFGQYSAMGLNRRTNPYAIQGHPAGYSCLCKDGWVSPTAGLGMTPNIALLVERPDLQDTPLFATPSVRMAEPEKFDAVMLPWLKEHDKWQITKEAQQLKVAFTPVLSPEELLEDDQLKAREFFVQADHPVMGKVKYPGAPAKSSETMWQAGRAPLLGEHNKNIYEKLGYTSDEIIRLREEGII